MSDEEHIRRLIAACAQRIDDRDVEGYVKLFAPHGRLMTRSQEFVGHDEIRKCMAGGWTIAAPASKTKHLVAQSVIQIDQSRGSAETDFVAFQCLGEGGWHVFLTGRYHDAFVIQADEWRFLDRRITVDAYLRSTY